MCLCFLSNIKTIKFSNSSKSHLIHLFSILLVIILYFRIYTFTLIFSSS
nr:MAG TPA: beta-sandwich protein [Crassvirales sp.]